MKTQSIVKGKTIKQVKKLNLSGQNLTEIPAYVFEYTNLTKLVLSRNHICKIPKEIAKLKKLEVLDMMYNELTEIPAPVFKLPKLRVLSVGHNKLRKFPKQLVGSAIEQLIADHNQIGELNPAVLDNLSRLIISNNPLGGQVVTHKLEKLLYYDFRQTNLSTPDSKLLPDDCKGYVPIHKAEITDEMYLTKMMYDFSKNSDSVKGTNGTIFISHSSKDKAIIEEFVDEILQLGMGIDTERISCTSIEEMGIPNGTKMREWIQDKIVDCKVAFLMISPNYKKSEICLYKYDVEPFATLNIDLSKDENGRLQPYCPLCDMEGISSFDHILPQSKFPELSDHPRNLIRSCQKCNGKKSANWKENGKRRYLNLYIDEMPSEQFLFAGVEIDAEADTLAVEFSVDNRNGIEEDMFRKVSNHFTDLEICSRYDEGACEVISSLQDDVVNNLDQGISREDIKVGILNKCRREQGRCGVNYWRAILKKACAEKDEILDFIIKKSLAGVDL